MTDWTGTGTPVSPITPSAFDGLFDKHINITSPEDLFLAYAMHYYPPAMNATGFRRSYGVYNPTLNEAASDVLGLNDRLAITRALLLAHSRMRDMIHYWPLRTYIDRESYPYTSRNANKLQSGYVRSVARRTLQLIDTVSLEADSAGRMIGSFTLPSDASIYDIIAFEPDTEATVRIPIAYRKETTLAFVGFEPATLVKNSVWAACGAKNTPCDGCAVSSADSESFLDEVELYYLAPVSSTGVAVAYQNAAGQAAYVEGIATVEDAVLGWVRSTVGTSVSCATPYQNMFWQLGVSGDNADFSYISGRWHSISDLPGNMIDALFGLAATFLGEAGVCQERTMPPQLRRAREGIPSGGTMQQRGLVEARAVAKYYAIGRGV